jgi:manganese/iron transport system permease protein/iron/zinc/copper transport system permease protein
VDTLLEPFAYGFFRHAIWVAVLTGGLCGLVGTYVVLRGMSYIGHGLSHAVFGGAAIAIALSVNPLVGAFAIGVVAAIMINGISRKRTIGADAAIGVITSALFAVGIAIVSVGSLTRLSDALLFGNVLGVTLQDVLLVAAVAVASAVIVFVRYRPLLFSTFDPEVAEVSGVRTAWIDLLLALMLASTITVTMNVVGVVLIAAMLVIPPVIARVLTDSFHRMLLISVATGAACGFVGVYLSYYLDWPSGATVVLTAAALFVVAYLVSSLRNRRAVPGVGFDVH